MTVLDIRTLLTAADDADSMRAVAAVVPGRWIVTEVGLTGDPTFPFHVVGINTMRPEEPKEFSWRVPSIASNQYAWPEGSSIVVPERPFPAHRRAGLSVSSDASPPDVIATS